MAEGMNGAMKMTAIENLSLIPIAQLTPLLAAPSSRAIKAVVTLTWPYSSATGSVAFLLSEPDFRLRRTRGQVRVQFSGSSAKAIEEAGIASGDEILLCLEGAEFVHDEATTVSTPGRCIEFELKFAERLILQFRPEGTQESRRVDIDHPALDSEPAAGHIPIPVSQRSPSVPTEDSSLDSTFAVMIIDEWTSPAFIKRSRTSYGSLFESDYDPFAEEDGTVLGKGRKKTRLSSSWRYTSHSPTPEIEDREMEGIEEPALPKLTVTMTDEACQTIGLEEGSAAEALADFFRQSTNVGSTSYTVPSGSLPVQKQGLRNEGVEVDLVLAPTANTSRQESANSSPPEREELPSSPQLHPIISESHALVSPLVLSRIGQWNERTGAISGQTDDIRTHPPTLSQNSPASAVEEEDLYGASPTHQGQEPIEAEFLNRQISGLPMNGLESSDFTGNNFPEHQYGQWESINAQMSHPHVQHIEGGHEDHRVLPHHVYTETAENPEYQNNMPQNISQYPELEDELPAQESSSWTYRQSEVPYPELPHTELPGAVSYPQVRPQSVVMSRSQSARSEAIDITEDSEEQLLSAQQSLQGDEDAEISGEGEQEEVLYPDENYQRDENRIAHLQRQSASDVDNKEQMSEAGDSYYDEEGYEDDYPEDDCVLGQNIEENELMVQKYNSDDEDSQHNDEDAEGEEESYDEDFDEEEEVPVKRVPEVIDLLSSDDEDEPSPAKRSINSAQPTPASLHSSAANEKADEDKEMFDPRAPSEDSELQNYDLNLESEEYRSVSGDEEDEEDSVMHTTGRENPDTLLQPRIASVVADQMIADIEQENETDGEEGPTRAKQSAYSQQQILLPVQSSLLTRAFSLDGANDDPEESESESHHPIFYGKHSTPPASIARRAPIVENGNAQLPTPDDTQVTEQIIYPNESFESSTQIQVEVSQEASNIDDSASARSKPLSVKVELHPRFEIGEETFEIVEDAVASQMGAVEESFDISENAVSQTQVEVVNERHETSEEMLGIATIDLKVAVGHVTGETFISRTGVAILEDVIDPSEGGTDILMEDVEMNLSTTENATSLTGVDLVNEELEGNEGSLDKEEEGVDLLAQISQKLDEERPAFEEPEDTEHISPPPAVTDVPLQDTSIYTTSKADIEEADEIQMHRSLSPVILDAPVEMNTVLAEFKTPPLPERDDLLGRSERSEEYQFLKPAREAQDEDDESYLRENSVDLVSVPQEALVDSPRRSARRAKLNPKAVNQKENTRSVTPIKLHAMKVSGSGSKEGASLPVILDTRATPEGHDASIELALDPSDSPIKPTHDLRKLQVTDKKLMLSRALRTDQDLSQYTSLKVLRYHLNQKLDVLAVATTSTPESRRAKGGPRHYQITFNVTDPSIAPSVVTEIQVYRPYQEALPIVKAGDGILLRNFLVISVKGRGFGLKSTDDGSSWAVFKDSEEPEIRGPPVEYGESEKMHVAGLKSWYKDLDVTAVAKINRANGDKGIRTSASPSKTLKG